MNPTDLPPPLPREPKLPPSGQWSHAADTSEGPTPKSKVWLWVVLGGGGCLGSILVFVVLATLVVPYVTRKYFSATRTAALAQMHELRAALDAYARTHAGQYPDSLEALVRPDQHGHTLLHDERELPRDPWGHAFVYEAPAPGHPEAALSSLGRDGRAGGRGLDADLFESDGPEEDR